VSIERIDLPRGDWADITSRVNHAQYKRIRLAATSNDQVDEGVAAVIVAWSIRDVDGHPLPSPEPAVDGIPVEAMATMPLDTFLALAERASEVLVDSTELVPKASGDSSTESAPGQRSPSRQTSRTPTSSRTSPDGIGTLSSPPQQT
jgi:hypothetical protein